MKNTITINKNPKKTPDKDDKRPDYNVVINIDEPIPAGKHYIGVWIRENKETKKKFMSGNIDMNRLKPAESKPVSNAGNGYVSEEEFDTPF